MVGKSCVDLHYKDSEKFCCENLVPYCLTIVSQIALERIDSPLPATSVFQETPDNIYLTGDSDGESWYSPPGQLVFL